LFYGFNFPNFQRPTRKSKFRMLRRVCPITKNTKNIKLYDRINDACEENERFMWHEIFRIHQHNNSEARPAGIVCHKCINNGKCIVSLKIDKKNTRFAVIEKIELSNRIIK
jgi:hypothetical protein